MLSFVGAALLAAGWVFDVPLLIQPVLAFAGVHFDAVVCLVLLSLANILPRPWRAAAFVLVALVGCSAVLTLLGYVLRFAQPIDGVLDYTGLISSRRSATLHMPFPTALSLSFVCAAQLIFQRRASGALHAAFALALAAVGALVVLQDLLTQQVFPDRPDYAGTYDIALQSSAVIVLLCAALALRAIVRFRQVGHHWLDQSYAWTTVMLVAGVLTAWEYQERGDWDRRAFETDVALKDVERELLQQLQRVGSSQQHLADRWPLFGKQTQETWQRDAGTVLQDAPALTFLAFIDLNRIVRWQVKRPEKTHDPINGKLDDDPIRSLAFDTADHLKSTLMTQTVRLPDGRMARLYLTPLFTGTVQDGYLMAALPLADVSALAPAEVMQDFAVDIRDYPTNAHDPVTSTADPGTRVRKTASVETFGQYWTVTVWPKESYLQAHRSNLLTPKLIFGGLMTFLMAAAFAEARQSQTSLRREAEAESQLATTLDHIDEGFLTLDRTWHITYANAQAAVITGHSKDQLIGSAIMDLSLNLDGIPGDKALALAMEGKGAGQFVGPFINDRALDAMAYPTRDGVAVVFREVTKERIRDQHLRLLETAVARQNDVLIITEVGGDMEQETQKIVYVNDAFTRLTGYTRQEAIGQSPQLLHGPATSQASLDKIRQAQRNRRPALVELVNHAKDGTQYWIEMDIAPIFDSQGTCTHFVTVERDVTERKRLEAESISNVERFQHIADASNDIIWDADLATGTVLYNENIKKILGYDPAVRQLTTRDWEAWVHPEDRDRATAIITEAVATPGPPVDMEYRICKADGTYAIMTDRAKVIRDPDGKPTRVVGTMSDVSERRITAERLRQAQQLEAVGQLTGGVAHDFNNLLTVILGNSELLAERLTEEPKLKKLAEMNVAVALRGAELTSRLLAFARQQPLAPKRIEVNALISGMEDWMHRTLPPSINIRIAGATDLWDIDADPHQLENALLNLAVNARDAMPQGGLLTVKTANCDVDADFAKHVPEAKPGQYVRISMQDNGSGMDPATLARAFEPFFTTKTMGKGSGLGLSMVYGFLRQSAGFASIDSVLGEGTTVHLFFPRATQNEMSRHPHAGPEKIVGGTEHILAVEDEAAVLENVVAKLEGLGYRVTAASTGTVALDIIAKDTTIDLLFTDIVMPGDLSGPQLVKRAEVIRPGLKVLYTSGYTDDTIIHDGKVDAGLTLLSKPYRLAELAEKVRAVLDA